MPQYRVHFFYDYTGKREYRDTEAVSAAQARNNVRYRLAMERQVHPAVINREIEWRQVEQIAQNPQNDFNEAFWRWFGNSVVRNEDGTPKVVYHGTNRRFSEFDMERVGSNFQVSFGGVFFTSDVQSARDYATEATYEHGTGSPRVVKAYLCIERPLATRAPDGTNVDMWIDDNRFTLQEQAGAMDADGVIVHGHSGHRGYGPESTTYIVFLPEQIKSINNDGTWDIDDPNIRSNPPKSIVVHDRDLEIDIEVEVRVKREEYDAPVYSLYVEGKLIGRIARRESGISSMVAWYDEDNPESMYPVGFTFNEAVARMVERWTNDI